jgi:hypothetical protein
VPALLLLLIMLLLYADCMLRSCSVPVPSLGAGKTRELHDAGQLTAATCLERTVLLRDKIPSIEDANS